MHAGASVAFLIMAKPFNLSLMLILHEQHPTHMLATASHSPLRGAVVMDCKGTARPALSLQSFMLRLSALHRASPHVILPRGISSCLMAPQASFSYEPNLGLLQTHCK